MASFFSGVGDVSGTGSTGSDGQVGTTAYQQLPPNYAQVLPEYKQLSPVYENVLPKYEQLPPKYEQVSPTSDPSFAKLLEQILNVTPNALPGIEQLTAQGMNSPLLQLVLGPALQRLQAPQAQARQNLTEQTRAAGGLRGSTYGQDMNKLVANQGLQQNDLMSQVIQQVLGTLVSGQLQSQQNSMLPGKSLTELLRTIAPQTLTGPLVTGQTLTGPLITGQNVTGQTITGQTGDSSGWGSIPPSQGLKTPMSSVGGTSPDDRDAQLRGFPNAEAMRFQQMLGASSGGSRTTSSGSVSGGGASSSYTPYLDPLGGGNYGGGSYDLGMGAGTQWLGGTQTSGTFTPAQGGPTYPAPTPEWNPTTGAYQGGYQPETVTEGWW